MLIKIIFILCTSLKLSKQYGNFTLEINGIYPDANATNAIKNVICGSCSWTYDVHIILYTQNQFCKNQGYVVPNTTNSALTVNCHFEDAEFLSARIQPNITEYSLLINQTFSPKQTYCSNGLNEVYLINLLQNATNVSVTMCNNTRLVYSYVYECTSPNYYPPGCSVYCVPRQTSDTCYNCSATGSKICCSGFSGDNCTQVTSSEIQSTTVSCNVNEGGGTSNKEQTYFIAMIVMSVVAGLLLIFLIILLILLCVKMNQKEPRQEEREIDYLSRTKVVAKSKPQVRVTRESREITQPVEERQLPDDNKYSIHSDSSEELEYFDRPWNQNLASRQYDIVERVQPQIRRNINSNAPANQRYSNESQAIGYQDPNKIQVLDVNEYAENTKKRRRPISGTYI